MDFDSLLDTAADFIKDHDSFTIISHADADGICGVAILKELCEDQEKKQTTLWLEQISTLALENMAKEASDTVIFLDMGSGHLPEIERLFKGKDILILDHHKITDKTKLLFVNPFLADMDGTKDISAAGIAYEVANRIINIQDLAYIAVIGAQADHHIPFTGINKKILDESGITEREGARLFGIHTKPLVPLIAFSYDLKIEGITGSMDGASALLRELNIDERKRFMQLSKEEQDLLDETLIKRSANPEPTTMHHTIPGMRGPLSDTREAASLLNACGRLGKPDLGVQVLLGKDSRIARDAQRSYRQEIKHAHSFYSTTENITEEDDLLIINAEKNILPSVAGTLCSSLARGRSVMEGTTVVCLAQYGDGTTKVSSRSLNGTRDLSELMKSAAEAVGGEGGGHDVAAGAIIPTEKEQEFVDQLLSVS